MKFKLTLCLIILACLVVSCRKKDASKAEEHQEEIELSDDAVVITPDKGFVFPIIDLDNYYIGEINNNTYYLKIDHIDKEHIIGRYYPVTDSTALKMHPFEIERKSASDHADGKECILCVKEEVIPIKFEISVDTDNISGWMAPTTLGSEEWHLAFEKYVEPIYRESSSPRYTPNCPSNYLSFQKKSDVVYGNAKGFWTSKPIRHEQMRKQLIQGLGQSVGAKRKNLELKMDLYLPEDSAVKRRPVIMLLHGGGFFFGDKAAVTSTEWCEHFASIGYVAVSANYRLGFKLTKGSIQQCEYESIQDAHAALRFLLAHADEYGIDTNNIFIGGTSAGSITALGAAFMTDQNLPDIFVERKLRETCGSLHTSGNNYRRSPRIKAVANMWGALYDLKELDGRHIPVVSFHGTADNTVPYDIGYPFSDLKTKIGERLCGTMYGSVAIHRKLDSLHIRNRFYPIEGASHAPYEDKSGKPNEIYRFIQDKIQKFFYDEINRDGSIVQDTKDKKTYRLLMSDASWYNWQVEGGFITHQDKNSITVVWRSDAKKRTITVSGERINGSAFKINKRKQ